MSINQRLVILFIAIIIAFSGFFYLFYQIRQMETAVFQESDTVQRRMTIDSIFEIKKTAQLKVASDYASSPGLYSYIYHRNADWADNNLGSLLKTFDYSMVQVYDRKAALIYSKVNSHVLDLDDFKYEPAVFDSVAFNESLFFYHRYKAQILATAGAAIYNSIDTLSTSIPIGYLFISHNWDGKYFNEIAKSLNYMVRMGTIEPTMIDTTSTQYNIRILKPIPDLKGNSISWLIFYYFNPYLKQLQLLGKQILIGTAGFIFIFLLIQYALLRHWISSPLQKISQSLSENNAEAISLLNDQNNEFADIALLIEKFFRQKQELISEIEERAKTEAKLREMEEQTRKIFLTSPESIIVTDLDGNILRVNDETYKLFATDIIGEESTDLKTIYNLAHKDSVRIIQDITKALPESALVKSEELELITKEGNKFPALISASMMFDSNRRPSKMIFITRDLSELKALEQRLRQSQKMESIGTLAGGIAHDFNNIITIIAGYIALSAGKIEGQIPAQNDLDEALKACLRAKNLVSKILTFSRMSEFDVQTINLASAIEDSLPMLRASIPSSIDIVTDINCNQYTNADPTEIQQILMNLTSNAFHAMRPGGGTLGISLGSVHGFELIGIHTAVDLSIDYLHLTVSDTGNGIPPSMMERIFDPYFSTKAPGEGSGLGLSIVHGIVSSCKGFVTVESELGRGTNFSIYLPVVPYTPVTESKSEDVQYDFQSAHILFVDDEPALSDLFGESLRNEGYSVQSYSDSQQALAAFMADPNVFDLIIADVTMPVLDGIKLASMIKAQRDIPVILYTGFADNRIHAEASKIKIERILNKPLLPDELLRIVREVISLDRA